MILVGFESGSGEARLLDDNVEWRPDPRRLLLGKRAPEFVVYIPAMVGPCPAAQRRKQINLTGPP
jgi:hypothetical protein